jgi:hypothetical protein
MANVVAAQPGFSVIVATFPNDGGVILKTPVVAWEIEAGIALPVTPRASSLAAGYSILFPDGRVVDRGVPGEADGVWASEEEWLDRQRLNFVRKREADKVAEDNRAMERFAKLPKG